jgi:hypothetical protein
MQRTADFHNAIAACLPTAAGDVDDATTRDHRKRAGIGFLVFLPHSQTPPADEHQRDDDDDQHNDVS